MAMAKVIVQAYTENFMVGVIPSNPRRQFLYTTSNRVSPLANGKVYTYLAGTTTPAVTYKDLDLTIANTNPIILDARGECVIYGNPIAYKFVVQSSSGETIYTQDNVVASFQSVIDAALAQLAGSGGASQIGLLDAADYYLSTNVEGALQEVGTAPRTVANVTAVRNLTFAPNTPVIFVQGRDGGFFRRDPADTTSAEDGGDYCGTVIRPADYATRGVFKRDYSGAMFVSWFGGRGDGVTDDTAAIQAAVDSVHGTLGGGTVYFPNGVYIVSDSIRAYSSMTLLGAGADFYTAGVEPLSGCVIKVASNGIMAGLPVFDVSGCRYTTVKGFTFLVEGNDETGNTTITIADSSAGPASFLSIEHNRSRYFGGPFLKLFGNVNSVMWNRANQHKGHIIHMDDSADNFIAFNDFGSHPDNLVGGTQDACLYLDGGANNTIIGNHLYNHGYGIRLTNFSNHNRIEGNRCEKHSHAGMQLDNADRNTLLGNHLFNNGYVSGRQGIDIKNGSSNNDVMGNYIFNFFAFPGNTNQLRGIQISGSSDHNKVSGNHLMDHEENSIVVDGSSFTLIDGNYVYGGKARGISVASSAHDTTISGNYVYGCGQGADNTYDGIFVDASDRVTVRGNTVRHGGGTAQHRYGICINSGATASLWTNDVTTAGRSAQISDSGSSTEIRANRGFATDNRGSAIIGAASTSVNVTHSLGRIPNIADISVTPTSQPTSATKFWISGATSTQFTINCDVAPGGSGWAFAWRAEVIR